MGVTLKLVSEVFKEAKEINSKYVIVYLDVSGFEEIIAIPQDSMDSKLEFYLGIYKEHEDGTLRHGMNKEVTMTDITHANLLI